MGKLICSKEFPFNMADWEKEHINRVYAGNACIMAITEDGRVLQKTADANNAARTEYWRNISDIALSGWYPGVAIGLVNDGTCMISKRPMRAYCEERHEDFDRINGAVKSWREIVGIAVSDAYFALDSNGRVHYCAFDGRNDDYKAVLNWENVAHITVGSQCSVFGVTNDGRILCAGHNCKSGPHQNLAQKLADINDAVDICAIGSECEVVLIAHSDGNVSALGADVNGISHSSEKKVFGACFLAAAIKCAGGSLTIYPYNGSIDGITDTFKRKRVTSFAVGHNNYCSPFVIAVGE